MTKLSNFNEILIKGQKALEEDILTIKETTTPSAVTDYGKVYTKSDNNLYFQDGAGSEKTVAFTSGSGSAGLELVGTTVISNDSEIVFTGLDDGYNHLFILKNVTVQNDDDDLQIQISRNGGSSYISTSYAYSVRSKEAGGSSEDKSSASASSLFLNSSDAGWGIGNANGECINATIIFFDPSNTSEYGTMSFSSAYFDGGTAFIEAVGGGAMKDSVAAYNTLRLYASSGNLVVGEIEHYIYKG